MLNQYKYSDHELETLFIISRQYWMKPLTTGELKLRELKCKLIPVGIYNFDKNINVKKCFNFQQRCSIASSASKSNGEGS